jgi:hypothetical protein
MLNCGRPSAMTRRSLVVAMLTLAPWLVAGCGQAESSQGPSSTQAPSPATAPTGSAPTVTATVFSLYTHCGISEAQVGTTYYLASPELSDGQGNPPQGWGNPFQQGIMTVLGDGTARFSDRLGHVVIFKVRVGATGFLRICS